MRCEVRGQEGAAATTAAATAASTTTAVQVEVRVELAEVAKPETGSLAIVEATRRHDRNWGGPPEMTALRRSFAAPAYKSSFVLLSLLGLLLRINPTTVASGLRLGSDRVAFIVHSKANNVANDDNNNDDDDDDDDDDDEKKDDENNYDEDDRFMHHSARANLDVDATNLIDTPGIIEDTRPTRYFPFISERSRLNLVRYQRSKAKIYSSTREGSLDRRASALSPLAKCESHRSKNNPTSMAEGAVCGDGYSIASGETTDDNSNSGNGSRRVKRTKKTTKGSPLRRPDRTKRGDVEEEEEEEGEEEEGEEGEEEDEEEEGEEEEEEEEKKRGSVKWREAQRDNSIEYTSSSLDPRKIVQDHPRSTTFAKSLTTILTEFLRRWIKMGTREAAVTLCKVDFL
ncbi:follistatin-A isoform X1 [Vespula squamosa]|uniref:Follistatin-A isoform X1 n=1 Tax=Vespula squamosa TaxID=30214 RepID=A0ABD2ACP4_VESSQ